MLDEQFMPFSTAHKSPHITHMLATHAQHSHNPRNMHAQHHHTQHTPTDTSHIRYSEHQLRPRYLNSYWHCVLGKDFGSLVLAFLLAFQSPSHTLFNCHRLLFLLSPLMTDTPLPHPPSQVTHESQRFVFFLIDNKFCLHFHPSFCSLFYIILHSFFARTSEGRFFHSIFSQLRW